MNYRKLGRTGLNVSEIGFGAWGIGAAQWIGAEDETSLRALRHARDVGINFFDTALAYGAGHSEKLIAQAFQNTAEVIIATKIPPKNSVWPARKGSRPRDVFPKAYVFSCVEESLRNLRREQLQLEQFHVWTDEWADDPEWLDTVHELKRSGKVQFLGISINDHQPSNSLKALETGLIDVVQVIFNLFDQSPTDKLFPFCREHQIGVIARVPFDEGSLTGRVRPDTKFPPGDFRNEYFKGDRKQEVWGRVQQVVNDTDTSVEQLPELALRFCLSDPAVATVIPGMRTVKHVDANARVSDAGTLAPALMDRLKRHRWVRNFYPE